MTTAPVSLQDLRQRIYDTAKAETTKRFWGLFVHVAKLETLRAGYDLAKRNNGAPGIDGVTFAAIEASGIDAFLAQLRDELVTRTYRPLRNRRVEIPKGDGTKVRVLGIPAIRDRVVQGALKHILEPIFEADFHDGSYGYRPQRSAQAAVARVAAAIRTNKTRVIDVDLAASFDTVRHDLLLGKVARRVQDSEILHLLKLMLKASGKRGVPQGGVISPLLSNIYLHEVDAMLERAKAVTRNGRYTYVEYARYADGMPEQTLDARVKVPPPQLPVQGSSSEAALAGDRRGQVPRHRPQEVAAERQAAAQANPHVSLVIRTCGGRPTRLLGKAATSREVMGTCTAMAPPGCQGRHVAMVQGSKSGRSGRTTEQVAPVLGAYKADRRSGVGVRPEVGGARITRAGEDNTTSSMVKLAGGEPTARRREVFARGRGPASSDALDRASAL